jgi:cobalt-zinc-cadmium efflux system outer membrane protein
LPEDDGPPDGLTLNGAIDQLLAANCDLAAKFQDIPKGRADVLTSGLRNDPVLFVSATTIPYGRFSEQRPGTTLYDVTLVQSIDVNGKHKKAVRVARMMNQVLEARYREAVRQEIDNLYISYVDVLEARAAGRAARANLDRLTELVEILRELARQGKRPRTEATRASIQLANARLILRRAEVAQLHATRDLAVLLDLPAEKADGLRLRGSLRVQSTPPPCTEELIQLALRKRPDLEAYRLSVMRSRAQVEQARAEGLEDIFLFYSPYQASDFTPQGKQVATSWQIGLLLPIPIFNRNQGNVARARANTAQWQIEVEREEQEVIDEVRRAAAEYEVTAELVRRYERDILPDARTIRDEKHRLLLTGGKDVGSFLEALRDYDEVVGQYLEAVVRHRRAMLKLNTAVGQCILP